MLKENPVKMAEIQMTIYQSTSPQIGYVVGHSGEPIFTLGRQLDCIYIKLHCSCLQLSKILEKWAILGHFTPAIFSHENVDITPRAKLIASRQ